MNYITTDKFNRTVRGENPTDINGQAFTTQPSKERAQEPRAIQESKIEAIFHWAYFEGTEDDKNISNQ